MSRPIGRRYQNVPVPFWFREKSYECFRNMPMRKNDVILSSGVKSGTTWVHKIIYSLLHVYDDNGVNRRSSDGDSSNVGENGQAYPSALPVDRAEMEAGLKDPDDNVTKFCKTHFGDFTLEDLMNQPEPRQFSTHWFGKKFLPLEFLGGIGTDDDGDEEGKGRLVIVLRNFKDVMVSLHFFRGASKDGWYGNEHGPGTLARFMDKDCQNAFGSYLAWIKAQDELVTLLQEQAARHLKKERVLVVYYEALKANFPAQLDQINDFLDLPPLTNEKRDAVVEACTFNKMKAKGGNITGIIMRKGVIGDWKNHLTPEDWDKCDEVFDRTLGLVALAQPLIFHQFSEERMGYPSERRTECTLETDPRTWPVFRRAMIRDGMVVPDQLIKQEMGVASAFVRPPSEYQGTVPSEKYQAESGRYHIFVSGICPWAQSVVTARHMLGLEDVISIDVADGQSSKGWVYLDGATIEPWKGRPGPFFLHEVYQMDDPMVTTRITVPVLWDTKTNSIVSNDSWTIIKIMSTAFSKMGNPPSLSAAVMATDETGHPTLTPTKLESMVESVHTDIYNSLLNGVYKAGILHMKNGDVENDQIISAREVVYQKLAELEDEVLSKQRFLCGEHLMAVDIRLAMTLLRWDSSYRGAFFLTGGRGGILVGDGYPNLKAYLRDIYAVIQPVVDFTAFRQYYRIRQALRLAHCSMHPEQDVKSDWRSDTLPPLPDLGEIKASVE